MVFQVSTLSSKDFGVDRKSNVSHVCRQMAEQITKTLLTLVTTLPPVNSCSAPPWRTRLSGIKNALVVFDFTGSKLCLRVPRHCISRYIFGRRTVLVQDECGKKVFVCCAKVRTLGFSIREVHRFVCHIRKVSDVLSIDINFVLVIPRVSCTFIECSSAVTRIMKHFHFDLLIRKKWRSYWYVSIGTI